MSSSWNRLGTAAFSSNGLMRNSCSTPVDPLPSMARIACSLMIWMNCRTVASSGRQGSLKSMDQILPPSRRKMLFSHLACFSVGSRHTVRAAMSLTNGFSFTVSRSLSPTLHYSGASTQSVIAGLTPARHARSLQACWHEKDVGLFRA
jgi:hypothetical protein